MRAGAAAQSAAPAFCRSEHPGCPAAGRPADSAARSPDRTGRIVKGPRHPRGRTTLPVRSRRRCGGSVADSAWRRPAVGGPGGSSRRFDLWPSAGDRRGGAGSRRRPVRAGPAECPLQQHVAAGSEAIGRSRPGRFGPDGPLPQRHRIGCKGIASGASAGSEAGRRRGAGIAESAAFRLFCPRDGLTATDDPPMFRPLSRQARR